MISDDGRILTAAHVVQTADRVVAELADGTLREARVVGSVPAADVALVQLDVPPPAGAVVATLGDSEAARVGLLVQRVAKDWPGDRLGLRGGSIPAAIEGQSLLLGGDVVLEAFGISVGDPDGQERIFARAGELGPDDAVRLVVLRAGEVIALEKSYGELTAPAPRR